MKNRQTIAPGSGEILQPKLSVVLRNFRGFILEYFSTRLRSKMPDMVRESGDAVRYRPGAKQ